MEAGTDGGGAGTGAGVAEWDFSGCCRVRTGQEYEEGRGGLALGEGVRVPESAEESGLLKAIAAPVWNLPCSS